MKLTVLILAAMLDLIPSGQTFLKPLQTRDSILVADQLEYGFVLEGVESGTGIALPELEGMSSDTLVLVRGWQLDTLTKKKVKTPQGKSWIYDIRASVVIAPFEEGSYQLPELPALRVREGRRDTLLFEASAMEVKTMPVDTATFVVHDLKGQMTYPVTFRELLPYLLVALGLAALVALGIYLVRSLRSRKTGELRPEDPPHIVALRELDKWRAEAFWAPEKQKMFYSGITDTLKTYLEARYGIDAPEMTTAELFEALKGCEGLEPELLAKARELFECADYVKFAKFVATDEQNASALPLAVRLVTTTYQSQVEAESAASGEEAARS